MRGRRRSELYTEHGYLRPSIHTGEWRGSTMRRSKQQSSGKPLVSFCKTMDEHPGDVECQHGWFHIRKPHWSCCGSDVQQSMRCSTDSGRRKRQNRQLKKAKRHFESAEEGNTRRAATRKRERNRVQRMADEMMPNSPHVFLRETMCSLISCI